MTSTPERSTSSTSSSEEVRAVSRRFRAVGLGTVSTTLLATAAVLTGGAAPATSAPATVTAPASPAVPGNMPSAIEALQPYVGQAVCSPSAKPGVAGFRDLLLRTYPRSGSLGIVRDCGAGGTSEHKEGRAFDWAVRANNPQDVAEVEAMFTWLFATDQYGNSNAMLRRTGLMYVIWNKKIWKAYAPDKGWQVYAGPNPHTDHVHMSFGWNGAKKTTSYWDRTVAPVDFGPRPPTLPVPVRTHLNISKRAPYENTVVKQGSAGDIVKIVQAGVLAKPVDGYYGPDTAAYVARFQASQNLPQTGVFGAAEWQRLFPYPTGPFGVFDAIESTSAGVRVSGWGIDADALTQPVTVRPVVDGTALAPVLANVSRPDVGSYYRGAGNNHGVALTIPGLSQGRHEVCLNLVNIGAGVDGSLNCRSIDVLLGGPGQPPSTPAPVATPAPVVTPTPAPVITPPPAQVSATEIGGVLVAAPARVDVPQDGSAVTRLVVRNSGSRAWPVGGIVRAASLSPGDPSGGKTWLNPNRPSSVSANVTRPGARTIEPGESAQLDIRLYGNGRAPVSYTETFGVVWDGVAFTDVKAPVAFRVVGAPQVRARVTTPARAVDVPTRGAVRTTFAAQNTGSRAWPVNGFVRTTSLTAGNPSKDASWLSANRPSSLAANLSRPGATTIEPGEIGRFDLTLAGNGRPAGSYREQFGIVFDAIAYTDVKLDVTYRVIGSANGAGASTAAAVAGELVATAARVDVPRNGTATTRFQVRNTGTREWPMNDLVRSTADGYALSMRAPEWLSENRPSSLAQNVTRPGATSVRPGEVAELVVSLAGNGRAPAGTQVMNFGVVYDGVAHTGVQAPVTFRIV